MIINEKGLAGSGDYPVEHIRRNNPDALRPKSAEPQYRGLMAGTILRHIAERASNCREALAIIEDFIAKGYSAGGKVNGNHWLFVDREGVILEVSNNARHVVSKFHTQKVYFSRLDNNAAARRLRESSGPVDFHLFHNVSRDPSICFGSSISGLTVEIDPDHPELFTCAWIPDLPLIHSLQPTPPMSRTPKFPCKPAPRPTWLNSYHLGCIGEILRLELLPIIRMLPAFTDLFSVSTQFVGASRVFSVTNGHGLMHNEE